VGASRRADAVEWLKERFEAIAHLETRQCILWRWRRENRTALSFLLAVIRNGSVQTSALAVSAMEINPGPTGGYRKKSKRLCGRAAP